MAKEQDELVNIEELSDEELEELLNKKTEVLSGGFSIIPAHIKYDNSLTDFEKLLFAEIMSLSNMKGFSWATNNYFSKVFAKSERSVSRAISNLKEKNYIQIRWARHSMSGYRTRKIICNFVSIVNKKVSYNNENTEEVVVKNCTPIDKNGEGGRHKWQKGWTQMAKKVDTGGEYNNINLKNKENEREKGEVSPPPLSKPLVNITDGQDYKSKESLFDEFEKDYLKAFEKITARTCLSINQVFRTGEGRAEFMTMYENAKFIKEAGYDYNQIINKILPDIDLSNPKARFEFHDCFRVALRNSVEKIKAHIEKKASVNKVKNETVENMEYDEEVEAIKRQSQKIPKEASQNLIKKLSEVYKLE